VDTTRGEAKRERKEGEGVRRFVTEGRNASAFTGEYGWVGLHSESGLAVDLENEGDVSSTGDARPRDREGSEMRACPSRVRWESDSGRG